jgi:hypothetical protein
MRVQAVVPLDRAEESADEARAGFLVVEPLHD